MMRSNPRPVLQPLLVSSWSRWSGCAREAVRNPNKVRVQGDCQSPRRHFFRHLCNDKLTLRKVHASAAHEHLQTPYNAPKTQKSLCAC